MGPLKLDLKEIKKLPPYIIWDGNRVVKYQIPKYHDCAVYSDGLLSVQNLRRDLILQGFEPIVIFSCKPLKPSYEVNIPGKGWHGLFSYCILEVFKKNPKITIREIIIKTNIEMHKFGLEQTCEVICRLDLLEHVYIRENKVKKTIALLQFDMCRTYNEEWSSLEMD